MNSQNHFLNTFFILLLIAIVQGAQAQCVPDSTVPNVAGIYPDTLFDARGCEFYEENITFFLPRDTTVSVGGVNVSLPFNSFTITEVNGLPEGMDWKCDLDSLGCFYDVSPGNPSADTLGCIRIFGTPEIPGVYPISVTVIANLSIGDQEGLYEVNLKVLPCTFDSDCYEILLADNCTPTTAMFNNLVASNGIEGFEYNWELTGPDGVILNSTDENPGEIALPDGGMYMLSYDAKVDTAGFTLTEAVIKSVNCSDPLDAGDLYWRLRDSAGISIFTSDINAFSNTGNDTPLATGLDDIKLPPGRYEFEVRDRDLVGQDDGCVDGNDLASVFFEIPIDDALLVDDTLTVSDQGLEVSFVFSHPVSFFACTDSFVVNTTPVDPSIEAVDGNISCNNQQVTLMTNAMDSIQWYLDGEALAGANDVELRTNREGIYSVSTFTEAGCSASSLEQEVRAVNLFAPSVAFDSVNTLMVTNPGPYTYEWYKVPGGLVGTGVSFEIAESGNYRAITFDTVSGCRSGGSIPIRAIILNRDPLEDLINTFEVYPNPNQGNFTVELNLSRAQDLHLKVQDLLGRNMYATQIRNKQYMKENIQLPGNIPPGIYMLSLEFKEGIRHRKIIVR